MTRRRFNLATRNSGVLRYFVLSLVMPAVLSIGLSAQVVLVPEQKDYNVWLRTENPVSIGIVTMPDIGRTGFDAKSTYGDFHKAMESGGINSCGFNSSGYKSLKPLNLWGSFRFSQEHHRGRCWSDNINPYNGNPYLTGSSVKGKYSYQVFDFSVKMSSKRLFGFMWAGIGLDYSLGDFSRLQDPRSRTQEIRYSITPGVAFRLGKETIGMNVRYGYSKEKIGSYVSKSKDSKEYLLYLQEGFGVYSTHVSSDYERRIESWYYGVALQYGHSFCGNSALLAEVSPYYRSDLVTDAYMATPGNYKEAGAELSMEVNIGNWIANSALRITSGSAQKISQKAVTVSDPSSGVVSTRYETIFSIKSYILQSLKGEVGLSYMAMGDEITDFGKWNVGCKLNFGGREEEYIYYSPSSSFRCVNVFPSVHGGGTLFDRNGHRLALNGELAYRINVADSFSISDELKNNVALDNVVKPDHEIMTSDHMRTSADLLYVFPLSIRQIRKRLSGFVTLSANMSLAFGFHGSGRNVFGISVGVFH